MTTVATVRGPVDTAELGRVLMHEHVFVLTEELRANFPDRFDEQAAIADAVDKLRTLKSRGFDTIVDPTVLGLGRYLPRVQQVNEQVDLHIIPATGYYTYTDLPFPLQYQGPGKMIDSEPLVDLFTADITAGIGDTAVRAGFLKCAIDVPGMTDDVARVLRAVATVHRSTGAPIMVHTSVHNQSGIAVKELLRGEGVDLSRVLLAHCGDTADLDYLSALAEGGCLLGMDRFGLDVLLPFEQRVATVAALLDRGLGAQLVLAHDAACHIDWFPPGARAQFAPNWHYTHISDDVLPALRDRGVTEAQLDTLLIDNPRRYFDAVTPY